MLSSLVFNDLKYSQQDKEELINDLINVESINESYYASLAVFIDKLGLIK
jgi:hypothetical protein